MKFLSSLALCLCIGCLAASAQNAENHKVIIKAHASEDLPADIGYRYPAFTRGEVAFKDGTSSTARFNYNFLLGEMQFIAAKGDTLSIANENDIKHIVINNDSFYLKKGVFETVGDYAYVKLAVKQQLRIIDNEKIGAYGIPSSASAITSLTIIENNNRSYKLSANENLVYAKEKTYYLVIKADNQIIPATRQNILKSYARNRGSIDDFISDNKIDFRNEADLKKLLEYCTVQVNRKKK